MKSRPIASGQSILASQNNDKRDDARGGSFLLVHQQLGSLALPTNPSNTNTTTIVINGTSIVVTWVSAIGSTPNNVLIGISASASVNNLVNFLRRPDLTTSTQVAASSANQSLLQYVGWAYPGSASSITPFSLNKNVNGNTDILTSFNITTTVTSGVWTAQTMQLYIQDGAYYIGTTRVLYNGGSTPTFTAPVSNPRIDLITADSSGTIALVTGTENPSPSAPAYPANKAVLAEVYHVVGETGIFDFENQQAGQGYFSNDVRPTLLIPYISSLSQVATGLFIQDPGSEAQGDVLYYTGSAWARLPAGTSGYVLQTKGAGANPVWTPSVPLSIGNNSDTTVTTSDTTIFSLSIPGLSANGIIKIEYLIDDNGGGGSLTSDQYGIKAGSSDLVRQTISSPSGNLELWGIIYIANQNSVSAQRINGVFYDQGSASASKAVPLNPSTTAVNLGSAWTLSFFYKKNSLTLAMRGISMTATILVP
jgi:hypothetical protein